MLTDRQHAICDAFSVHIDRLASGRVHWKQTMDVLRLLVGDDALTLEEVEAALKERNRLAELHNALMDVLQAIGTRLQPPPQMEEAVIDMLTRAARQGDEVAIHFLRAGTIEEALSLVVKKR